MRRVVLCAAGVVLAFLTLWRFAVLAERSERSGRWRPPPAATAGPGGVGELERLVFENTNRKRRWHGLPPLANDATLAQISRRHSSDMLRRGYFDHVTPEGVTPEQRVAAGHRSLIGVTGENVWSGSGYPLEELDDVARIVVDDWMESPGHRENVLRPGYTHLGIGIATQDGELRATQSFAAARAYLRTPLPQRVQPGDLLDLAMTSYGETVRSAELFNLRDRGREREVTEPQPVTDARVPAVAGTHQLCLYFPKAPEGSYSIYFGPEVEVR